MKITIAVDNCVSKRRFLSEHGFSLLISYKDKNILFDTGQGYVLEHNLGLLGVRFSEISKIVLSHGHNDHTGGLHFFSEEGIFPELFAHPDAVLPKFKIKGGEKSEIGLKENLSNFRTVFRREPFEVLPGVFFSGEVPKKNAWELEETAYFRREPDGQIAKDPFSDDISLYAKTPRGMLVLTGCAHSGIVNIINYGFEITGEKKLFGIIGGMHLKNASSERIKRTASAIKSLNPEFVTVSHCTGFDAGAYFREVLGKKAVFTGVSDEFDFDISK